MSINVKFFARLREQLGQSEIVLPITGIHTVLDVWQQATGAIKLSPNTVCALNLEYVSSDHTVADGDEVAFFPPVTGG